MNLLRDQKMRKLKFLSACLIVGMFLTNCDTVSPVISDDKGGMTTEEAKGTNTRGSWSNVDSRSELAYCRDIAANQDVLVISNDGKSIWIKEPSASSFKKIPFTSAAQSILNSDPAVKIEIGKKVVYSPAPRVGIWEKVATFSTESGALYEIQVVFSSGENWYLVHVNENGPTANQDFTVTHNNKIFLANSNSIFELVNGTWKHKILLGGPVISLSDKTMRDPGEYGTINSLTFLTNNNALGRVIFHPTYHQFQYRWIDTDGVTPNYDVEQSFSNDSYTEAGYATFSSFNEQYDKGSISYRDYAGSWVSLGGARRIAIDANKKLWDAWTGGIWSIQLD